MKPGRMPARTKPLARTRLKATAQAVIDQRRAQRNYAKQRQVVLARSGGYCEVGGERLDYDWQCHHRRLRSAGGEDCPCNLLALCPGCHHQVVHAYPEKARDVHGWIVSRHGEPPEYTRVDVWMRGIVRRLLLTCDGEYA